jgi:hypothetical protein
MNANDSKRSICRHIKTNGRRCQSPALSGSVFCYYHRFLLRQHRDAAASRPAPLRPETVHYLIENNNDPSLLAPSPALKFPPLEDAESIQLSISLLFSAIAAGQIDPNQARSLLYALQIASCNLRVHPAQPDRGDNSTLVRRVVRTHDGHSIAAPDDGNGIPPHIDPPKSVLQIFLEENCYPNDTKPTDSTAQAKTDPCNRNKTETLSATSKE